MEVFEIKRVEHTCNSLFKNMIKIENKISKFSARGDKFLTPG